VNIDSLVDRILDSYEKYGLINRNDIENFPNRQNVVSVLQDLQSLILPGFKAAEDIEPLNIRFITGQKVNNIIAKLTREIQKSLIYTISKVKGNSDNIENSHCFKLAERTSIALIEEIPELRRKIQLDTIAAYNGDPAAHSKEEVILSYPGLEAIVIHRIANFLYKNGIPIIPRIMSEHVHGKTGIDIHPGATIGESFFIDHGTGVVIGETCVIGKNVKIYQGVTLGALSPRKGQSLAGVKRHPTVCDNVTIYSGASILGGETVIGEGAIIGGNSFITESVEAGAKVSVKKPELIIK
jgi:serine O-acetyltransferase